MAAIAHSDPYEIFMRKIGYSVGLENSLVRFADLQEMYLANGDVTLASWKNLVGSKDGWGLKTDNIADVFHSLGIIHRTPGDVLALENLDAAAIAVALLTNAQQESLARSFIFLWAVLVNDGEIFMNLLLAGFREEHIKKKLCAMIKHKRRTLGESLPGKDAMRRISRVVTIERQEKNKGSASSGQSVSSLIRTEPLQSDQLSASRGVTDEVVEFSDDYFRKVPPRRKDWARTLGLWLDGSGFTPSGVKFVESLRSAGYIGEHGFFVFWPMEFELVRAGFKSNLLDRPKTLWESMVDFGKAYADLEVKPFQPSDTDKLVEQIASMLRMYRSLHTRKAMLRRELPITVAYPAAIAIACAKGEPVIDFPKALDAEQKGNERRISLRRSRNTGGALSVKR